MQIRELEPGDVGALRTFFSEVPAADRTFFKTDVTHPAVAERWIADGRSVRLVALEGPRITAFAGLQPGYERSSHVAELRLVVAEAVRRQGVGAALTRRILVAAMERRLRKVTVEVAAEMIGPIAMFRGLGFEPEALLRDQLCDADGALHDVVVLSHMIDDNVAALLTAGIDREVG